MKKAIFVMLVFAILMSTVVMAVKNSTEESNGRPNLIARFENRTANIESRFGNRTAEIEARFQNRTANMESRPSKIQERESIGIAKLDALKAKLQAKLNATISYGQCVSAMAEEKNDCFNATKVKRDACLKDSAKNSTETKQCRADYKKENDECKKTFKSGKSENCAKIKHNFLETFMSSWK